MVTDTFGDITANSIMGSRPYQLGQIQVSQWGVNGEAQVLGYFYFISLGC